MVVSINANVLVYGAFEVRKCIIYGVTCSFLKKGIADVGGKI